MKCTMKFSFSRFSTSRIDFTLCLWMSSKCFPTKFIRIIGQRVLAFPPNQCDALYISSLIVVFTNCFGQTGARRHFGKQILWISVVRMSTSPQNYTAKQIMLIPTLVENLRTKLQFFGEVSTINFNKARMVA